MTSRFERRHLEACQTGDGWLLAATSAAGLGYRTYLSGANEEAICEAFSGGVVWHRKVGRGVLAVTSDTSGCAPAETGLFNAKRCLLAIRNGESVEAALDWIAYHLAFGVNGVLIFDQAAPGEDLRFASDLEARLRTMGDAAPFVLYVTASRSVGQSSGPDARLAVSAPAAPGHVRQKEQTPDPWHSAFTETILLETLRRRFLGEAASVAFLNLSDLLLAGRRGETAFDRAEELPGRCYLLEGKEYYPWRLRKGGARHVDHVYLRRDEPRKVTRWCVAPTTLEDPSVWRMIRVGGARGVVEGARFVRAMGVAYPGAKVGQLVRKSALIEDYGVRSALEDAFGVKALAAPVRVEPEAGGDGVTVVTAMKNEGPFILDWIAHHRVVGVDRFLVYTNDCDDGTDEVLDALAGEDVVVRRDNPYRETGNVPQHAAFRAAESEAIVTGAEWCLTLDVDEYINVHKGEGTLQYLFTATDGANVISMPWRLFGNGDLEVFEDAPVTQQFHACAPEFCSRPHQAWGFKTVYKNAGLFRRLGVHRPKGIVDESRLRWVGGDGRPLPAKMWKNGWRMTSGTWGYDLVTLNHYAVRSAESYLVKRDRGRVNHVDRGQGVAYWFRMNHNAAEDRSIRRYDARVAEERARLAALPGVQGAHERSVEWHRGRIGELMQLSDFAELYGEITGARLKHLSRMLKHFGSNVFLSGPDVIPDEILERPAVGDWQFTIPKPKRAD
ncbi:MAG: glycosyltransferase family 2 protein [Boseongicola sp.]|nr:glycosyltransferase family 2 protein [Boseongicola sp.]